MKRISNIIILNLLVVFALFAQEARTTIITNNGMTLEKTETGSPEILQQAVKKLYSNFTEINISTGILLDRYTLSHRIDKLSYNADSIRTIEKYDFRDIYYGLYRSYLSSPKIDNLSATDSLMHSYLINKEVESLAGPPLMSAQGKNLTDRSYKTVKSLRV